MKRILIIALAIVLVMTLAGCNRGILDVNQKYDNAIISIQTICRSDMSVTNVLPNGVSYNADEIRC